LSFGIFLFKNINKFDKPSANIIGQA